MRKELILVGAGGHARSCMDVIDLDGKFKIAGLIGLRHEIGSRSLGVQVIGEDNDLFELRSRVSHAFVTAGQIKSPLLRQKLFILLRELNFLIPTVISPKAYVSPYAKLGMGTIVMHGAIVNAGAQIGDNCIVNSQSLIEHDVIVGDHCHISTGVMMNGGSVVGEGSFLGSRCVVREGIKIAQQSVIAMGSVVNHDFAI